MADLPWMRATRVSDTGAETLPPPGATFGVEAFFGMPRRLRLMTDARGVTGIVQRPYGTNYALWLHPLTPYYRQKPGTEALPVHPRAGAFSYRHWLGILADARDRALAERALCLRNWDARLDQALTRGATVIVAGWAMDNMKPRDFTWSVQPEVSLPLGPAVMLAGLVEGAESGALALRAALEPVLAGGEVREGVREAFYQATEAGFRARFADLVAGRDLLEVGADWLADLRRQALAQFDALALPALAGRETDAIQAIVAARGRLIGSFSGYGKYGKKMYDVLMLDSRLGPVEKGRAA